MAYSQSDIENLEAAVARGVTRARVGNEEVQYDSLSAMRRQIAVMKAEVAGRAPGAMQVTYPRTSRGL
ncbi:hypothetical protein LGQ03_07230 [Loktanella sp. TSTF-M6]|uniref:GpW protein n=1 Tax=Loktanella gaetbuli TaxID=2881335 RepID=A0ABS8BTI1_9RHOB|nr:hypothetical protein [Loktanella gaetbuli]MCB5199028.1 hypothetical protein [Loktanella gaetbuli]